MLETLVTRRAKKRFYSATFFSICTQDIDIGSSYKLAAPRGYHYLATFFLILVTKPGARCISMYCILCTILYGFFPYDGYYSETDRTGAVQKTIYYCQRPPPNYMMY